MSRRTKYLIVIVMALLALVFFLCWRVGRDSRSAAPLVRWGRDELAASEQAYYADRIRRIVLAWTDMAQSTDHDEEGRLREPCHTLLVIDVLRREIWIEDSGQVLDEYRSELPAQLAWTLCHDVGHGADAVGSIVRLKRRGIYSTRQCPEIVWLIGQGSNESLVFRLSGLDQGIGHTRGGGPFKPDHYPPLRKDGVGYYASMLVDEAEYEQSRLSWAAAGQGLTSSRRLLATPADESKAAWAKVEKKLYRAIEGQVNRAGFHLLQLQVQPGPDCSAAHAVMQVARVGLLQEVLGRRMSLDACLMIDYLGGDIWYARIAPSPLRPPPRPHEPDPLEELPLEFLVSADQRVPSSARHPWIEKGRAGQRPTPNLEVRWTATLANGTVIQFLGIGEDSVAGKQWWGPDGRPIDRPPCFKRGPENRGVGDRRIFEFAWRVQNPDGGDAQNISMEHVFEGGSAFDFAPCCDRYGFALLDEHHDSYVFEPSQEKTTFALRAKLDHQVLGCVRFKNLSLVPGKDQGFEIEVTE